MHRELIETIRGMNPWWNDERWYEQDQDYKDRVRKSPFEHRWLRIIDKAVKELIEGEGTFDMLILAGPRRTGKTSIMKRIIEMNSDDTRKNFLYIALDDFIVRRHVENEGLRYILSEIINEEGINEPMVIIIDEASAIENWDIHVKNVFDFFAEAGKRFLMIVTGSLGLRLIEKSTNVLGRRGDIPALSRIANPGLILPYKFSEFAEAIDEIRKFIKVSSLLCRDKRMKLLCKLAKKTKQENGNDSLAIAALEYAYEKFGEELECWFLKYLMTGGYPLIVYETLVKNQLHPKWHSEFSQIILEDIKYTNLRRDIAQCVLDYLREKSRMASLIDLDKLEGYVRNRANLSRSDLRQFRIEDYIKYFTGVNVFVKANSFPVSLKKSASHRKIKLFFLDPFLFHAVYFGEKIDPLNEVENMLRRNEQVGLLVEHIVCAHFFRLPKPILYYYIQENRETQGEIDCICYFNDMYIPVEIKYTESERRIVKEIEKILEILEKIGVNARPIVVSKNVLELHCSDYVIIPAYLFLILF